MYRRRHSTRTWLDGYFAVVSGGFYEWMVVMDDNQTFAQ
ncbi:uncharacterized protein METZ01_LOCUS371320, partial [marine metagenome]